MRGVDGVFFRDAFLTSRMHFRDICGRTRHGLMSTIRWNSWQAMISCVFSWLERPWF